MKDHNWIATADKRTSLYRDMLNQYKELKNAGLLDSPVRKALGQRFVSMCFHCSDLEKSFLDGEMKLTKDNFGVYVQAVNAFSGLASKLGLERIVQADETLEERFKSLSDGRRN